MGDLPAELHLRGRFRAGPDLDQDGELFRHAAKSGIRDRQAQRKFIDILFSLNDIRASDIPPRSQ